MTKIVQQNCDDISRVMGVGHAASKKINDNPCTTEAYYNIS